MSVLRTTSPMTSLWSAQHKCTAMWVSGASGAPALDLVEPVGSNGARRRAHAWSFSTHHPLETHALTSQRSESVWSRGGNVQEHGGRMSVERRGIATTAKIKRIQRGEERERERGNEKGRETQLNVKTLITGTKQSTGIEEAMTQSLSLLKKALYSSARDRQVCSSSSSFCYHPILFSPKIPFLILWSLPLFDPSLQGCCCYLYDLNLMLMHKQNGAHSAMRLRPLWTFLSPYSLCSFTLTTERVSLL